MESLTSHEQLLKSVSVALKLFGKSFDAENEKILLGKNKIAANHVYITENIYTTAFKAYDLAETVLFARIAELDANLFSLHGTSATSTAHQAGPATRGELPSIAVPKFSGRHQD